MSEAKPDESTGPASGLVRVRIDDTETNVNAAWAEKHGLTVLDEPTHRPDGTPRRATTTSDSPTKSKTTGTKRPAAKKAASKRPAPKKAESTPAPVETAEEATA